MDCKRAIVFKNGNYIMIYNQNKQFLGLFHEDD